jgi:DNA-binding transcriptional ArsR family regulator
MSPRLPNPRLKAQIFAALGDETRLQLVVRLSDGQLHSIAQLTADSSLTRQAVTKHLHVLERAKIVHSRRLGRESLFELNPQPLIDLKQYLEIVSERWDQALGRLKLFVEAGG